MEAEQQTRRQVCRQCSSVGLVALGGAVLGACGGRVLNGPASRSLRQYPTQFASGVLTITA
jgi:hypothetical protein